MGMKTVDINRPDAGRRREKERLMKCGCLLAAAVLTAFCFCQPAFAAEETGTGAAIVQNGFSVIYNIIAAIVSSLGTIYLLWGIFEWAQSLNTQDGGAQSMAFKRIAAGLVATLGPQLIPIINASIGASGVA